MPFANDPQERDLHDNSGASFEDLVHGMYGDDSDDQEDQEDEDDE